MLGTGVQLMCIRKARVPRDGMWSLAVAHLAAQLPHLQIARPKASESRPSKIRRKAPLQIHHFAPAQSNSFRMTLLYKSKNNFRRNRRPGRIVRRESLLESAHSVDNRVQKPANNKSLRITLLYKRRNNCPGITLLQKKVGGGGGGALSVPNDPGVGTRPVTPLLKEESR